MTLTEKLEFLYALRRDYRQDNGFRPPYIRLLNALGNPHHNLPPVIHVAGTNGKGSTIAFMRAILQQADYRVHAYTSPHLLRANERIVLAGQMIDDTMLEFVIDQGLARCPDPEHPDLSFFEFFTACAMTAFAHTPGDVLLLETGLGGRLDSTNIVTHPLITTITTLSYDHTEILGADIRLIASEKAGIMKTGCPCVVGHQIHRDTIPVLRNHAQEINAPISLMDTDWSLTRQPGSFSVQTREHAIENLPLPSLRGDHQISNAALAVATLLTQKRFVIPFETFSQGLQCANWPGRLQKIDTHLLPQDWELWLDCGHNDSAATVLAAQAQAWKTADAKPLHIVTGMMGHKDAESFAAPLAPFAASVLCLPLHNPAAMAPEVLAQVWRNAGAANIRTTQLSELQDILGYLPLNGPASRILMTGSLHLASVIGDKLW
jgi:dihydrofolate synthase/folylpolyglutamate synthase